MEDLAEVSDVSIVSIVTAIAVEASYGFTYDELISVAELVGHVCSGYGGKSQDK